ncbi:heterokaryon incompatibility protein-domain-containing protein [Cercophora newfieldiana]|uniref:Heterokaryon incompatibility protein-domain-containing protein n=1 Tax=Cercophora newfieldiana TaxID=92897 RepID=A0AA39Y8L3_9PEZI|nr:heterokaryon incompatibility protein-domain-containing protein [Cercophora newfieldiana]
METPRLFHQEGARPSPYHYRLRIGEVRLVSIHAGEWQEPISCSLANHFLEDLPPYSALSYTWGSAKATDQITFNGIPWSVTINLTHALRFLRHATQDVRLWVDAICINQHDLEERGSQVRLMRDIYSGCDRVIIYLGDGIHHRPRRGIPKCRGAKHILFHGDERDNPHITAFWGALSSSHTRFSNFHVFCLLRVLSDNEHVRALLTRTTSLAASNLGVIIEKLRLMMLSSWWHRVWVVQELAVSNQAIIRYGPLQAPWTMFVAASISIQNKLSDFAFWFGPEGVKVLHYFNGLIVDFNHVRTQWQSAIGGAPLLSLLQNFNTRRATDERDKVFALLGVVLPRQRAMIESSYYSDVPDVYRQTALALMGDSGTLDLWAGDLTRKSRGDLPSWVPDWNAVFAEADLFRARADYPYNVCGPFRLNVLSSRSKYWDFLLQEVKKLLDSLKTKNLKLPRSVWEALDAYMDYSHEYFRLDDHASSWRGSCEALRSFCTVESCDWTSELWIKRLFSCSAVLPGFLDPEPLAAHQKDAPDLSRKHLGLYDLDYIFRRQEPFTITEFGFPKPFDSPRKSFLSIETLPMGTASFIGEKLISWSDWAGAFSTLRDRMSYVTGHPEIGDLPDAMALPLARTLIAGMLPSDDAKVYSQLSHTDHETLLRWFRTTIVPAAENRTAPDKFLTSGEFRRFDSELIYATEGRVMFKTGDGTLGLGPGSMAVGDEVRVMPGGKSHIVLRRYSGKDHNMPDAVKERTFTVVGDCYLDCEEGGLAEVEEKDKDWALLGSLPRDLLPFFGVFDGNEDMLRRVKGERVYLV